MVHLPEAIALIVVLRQEEAVHIAVLHQEVTAHTALHQEAAVRIADRHQEVVAATVVQALVHQDRLVHPDPALQAKAQAPDQVAHVLLEEEDNSRFI